MTEWEFAFHEVLDISRSYSNITRSVLAETDAKTLNKELESKNMKEYYEVVKQVFDFRNERGNPYKVVGPVKLHHFILKQVVSSNKSDCILSFLENGSKNYLKFREERFLKKEKKLADTIKQITVPKFLQKNRKTLTENKLDATESSLKLLGKAQKKKNITCSGDYTLREIV